MGAVRMKICIHRGRKEIGGTCIEIESQRKRLVLDVGLPIDATDPDSIPLHPVRGFDAPDDSLLGVLISHPHQDHYGLAYRLPEETPFLIGRGGAAILAVAANFSPGGLRPQNVRYLADRTPLELGPFTITPFLVDHSAYDAYAVLVEADGERLFYSGDLRAHGRKSSLFEKLIGSPPKGVDVILTGAWRPGAWRQTEFQVNLKLGLTPPTWTPSTWTPPTCGIRSISRRVAELRL